MGANLNEFISFFSTQHYNVLQDDMLCLLFNFPMQTKTLLGLRALAAIFLSFCQKAGYFLICNVKTPTLIRFWYWTVRTMYARLCSYIVRTALYVL